MAQNDTKGRGNMLLTIAVLAALYLLFTNQSLSGSSTASSSSGSAGAESSANAGSVPTIPAPGSDPLAGLGDPNSSSGSGSGSGLTGTSGGGRLRDMLIAAAGGSATGLDGTSGTSGAGTSASNTSGADGSSANGTSGSAGDSQGTIDDLAAGGNGPATGSRTEADLTRNGVLLPIAGGLSCRTPVPIGQPVVVHDRGVAAFTTRQYKARCATSQGEVLMNFASTYVWRQYHDLGTSYRAQVGVRVVGETEPRGVVTGDTRIRAIQSVPVPTIGYCTHGWGALAGIRAGLASKVC